MTNKSSEEAIKRVEEMQKLYEQVLLDNKKMNAFYRQLRKSDKNMQALGEYYSSDWMIDQEEVEGNYPVLGQDEIWEALLAQQAFYAKMLK